MKSLLTNFSICFIIFLAAWATSCSTPSEKKEVKEGKQTAESPSKKTILFFGNSLTAGYGIDPEESFAGRIQARLDSLEKDFRVINGGLSGETTAGGLSRLDWFLEEEPYLFVLELGGNDGLHSPKPRKIS